MEVSEALLKRRSVRRFTEEPVSETDEQELLHAAMSGPSACNMKPWEFYLITNPEKLEDLRKVTRFTNIKAPLCIVVAGDPPRFLPKPLSEFWVQDCSAATENILLRATDLGLGAVWCGIWPQEKAAERVSQILGIREKQIPLNIIHIGHPAEFPEERDQYQQKNVHFLR